MAIRLSVGLVGALSILTTTVFAAPAAKPAAKAPAAKAAATKPAAAKPAKPAPTKPVATAKPASKGTAAKAVSEPPPGVRVQPQPGQTAQQAAQPTQTAKAKPARKKAAKSGKKKKHVAKTKTHLKSGRAAVGGSASAFVDENQLEIDMISDADKKSPLDLLASYKETVREGDLETAGVLVRLAAQDTPDHALLSRINDLLGVSLNTEDTEILTQIARASRADAFAQDVPAKSAPPATSPVSTRVSSAHAATENVTRNSRIEALVAYKLAMTEERPDAAALALGSLVDGTVDENAVARANTLLGISSIIPAQQIVAEAMPTH